MLNKTISRRSAIQVGGATAALTVVPFSLAVAANGAAAGTVNLDALEQNLQDLEYVRASVVRLRNTRASAHGIEHDIHRYRLTAQRVRDIAGSNGVDTTKHLLAPTEDALKVELETIQVLDQKIKADRYRLSLSGKVADAATRRRLDLIDGRVSFVA